MRNEYELLADSRCEISMWLNLWIAVFLAVALQFYCADCEFAIAAFNIQTFGKTKMTKPEVVAILVEVSNFLSSYPVLVCLVILRIYAQLHH